MGDFDKFTVDDLHEIVQADKLDAMKTQAQGWQGMASMMATQLARLDQAVAGLKAAWNSPAGEKFLAEVNKVRKTLDVAQQKAASNHTAWTAIASRAETNRTQITTIRSEYQAAWGTAQSNFRAAQKKDADNVNWAWGGLGDLWDDPSAPDQNAVRKPFDQRAQAAMQSADTVYTQEYYQNLWWPPDYNGPTDALVTANQPGGGRSGGAVPAGTVPAGAAPPGAVPPGAGAPPGTRPPGTAPPGSAPPPGTPAPAPPDGTLVWQPPPPVPAPAPVPVPSGGGVPPGQLPPGTMPPGTVPPGLPGPVLPGRIPPTPSPSRLPGGTRPPLVPEIPETTPVVGRTATPGRAPVRAGNEPVIGGRRPPTAGQAEQLPGRGRGVPGGRTAGVGPRVTEEVVGGRGAPRPPTEPMPRGGQFRPGSGAPRPVPAGEDGVVRPGRATPPGGSAGRGPVEGRSSTGRPGGKGTADGGRSALRRGRDTDGQGGLGRGRRDRDRDRPMDATDLLDETGLFTVDGAVPAVIEPAGPAAAEPPGPHVGGATRNG